MVFLPTSLGTTHRAINSIFYYKSDGSVAQTHQPFSPLIVIQTATWARQPLPIQPLRLPCASLPEPHRPSLLKPGLISQLTPPCPCDVEPATCCSLIVNDLSTPSHSISSPARPAMTIVLAHPSQSTLLTRRAGPAAAKRPSPPCWLAWQRDPQFELEDLRTFYHRECTRAETIKRTVASRRKLGMRSQSPPYPTQVHRRSRAAGPVDENADKDVQMAETDKPAPSAPTEAPAPLTPSQPERTQGELLLLGMYSSLLESRLQSVERVSKLLSDWRQHKPLSS